MARISVVIPALNEEKYLPNLLRSLEEQTRKDFAVVVVDGSSKDRTVQVARSFGSRLADLQVIVSPKPGVSLQRNVGAQATRSEWLVFVDADSRVSPHFIERVEQFITERKPEFFTAWALADGDTPGEAIYTLLVNLVVEGSLVVHRPVAPGALIAVGHDLFDQVGGFDETITYSEDYDLTQRITARGTQLQVLRETVYVYSLRRVRKEGKLHFTWFYAKSILRVLITNKNLRRAPAYVMGGQFFEAVPAPDDPSRALGR